MSEDPCTLLNKQAANDPNMVSALTELQGMVKSNDFEAAFGIKWDKNTYNFSLLGRSASGSCEMNFALNGADRYDGVMHYHFSNCTPIFSVGDLGAICDLCNNDNINNESTFIFGVVTTSGTYMLRISDFDKFRQFVDNMNEWWFRNAIEVAYEEHLKDKKFKNFEAAFLDEVLKKFQTGIEMYKAKDGDSRQWEKQVTDDKGKVNGISCN